MSWIDLALTMTIVHVLRRDHAEIMIVALEPLYRNTLTV